MNSPRWHIDPDNSEQYRWWDGQSWTNLVHPIKPPNPSTLRPERYNENTKLNKNIFLKLVLLFLLLTIMVLGAFILVTNRTTPNPALLSSRQSKELTSLIKKTAIIGGQKQISKSISECFNKYGNGLQVDYCISMVYADIAIQTDQLNSYISSIEKTLAANTSCAIALSRLTEEASGIGKYGQRNKLEWDKFSNSENSTYLSGAALKRLESNDKSIYAIARRITSYTAGNQPSTRLARCMPPVIKANNERK